MKIITATSKELQIIKSVKNCNFKGNDINYTDNSELLVNTEDSFLLLVCVEIGDDTDVVKKISHRVIEQWESHKTEFNNIVLVPFGHLSEIAQPSLNKVHTIIDKLYRVLKNQGMIVHKVEPDNANFLFSKLLIFDNGTSVRFSSSSNGLKALIEDVLSIYGVKKVLSNISKLLN